MKPNAKNIKSFSGENLSRTRIDKETLSYLRDTFNERQAGVQTILKASFKSFKEAVKNIEYPRYEVELIESVRIHLCNDEIVTVVFSYFLYKTNSVTTLFISDIDFSTGDGGGGGGGGSNSARTHGENVLDLHHANSLARKIGRQIAALLDDDGDIDTPVIAKYILKNQSFRVPSVDRNFLALEINGSAIGLEDSADNASRWQKKISAKFCKRDNHRLVGIGMAASLICLVFFLNDMSTAASVDGGNNIASGHNNDTTVLSREKLAFLNRMNNVIASSESHNSQVIPMTGVSINDNWIVAVAKGGTSNQTGADNPVTSIIGNDIIANSTLVLSGFLSNDGWTFTVARNGFRNQIGVPDSAPGHETWSGFASNALILGSALGIMSLYQQNLKVR